MAKMPQKSKPKKKKTGGGAKKNATKSAPSEDGSASADAAAIVKSDAAQEKDDAAAWLAAEKAEIAHMESKMARDNGWYVRTATSGSSTKTADTFEHDARSQGQFHSVKGPVAELFNR